MHAFYSDHFVLPLPPGHRFPMAKYALLRAQIERELPPVRLAEAPAASDGELALAHHPVYVAALARGTLSETAQREIGFPWSPALVVRARRSVGATLAAARVALREGVAANLAGGTHHAYADKGGGYCVFNDVAVAARLMQAEWGRGGASPIGVAPAGRGPLRVAVIDLDLHQGNGTARIFQHDPSVFTLSLHGERNFPFRKERSDLDVALPDGCGDADYAAALTRALTELAQRFAPQLVFYLAGADPFQGDRLGRLKLSFEGRLARDRQVFDWCRQRRVPLALVMAGGYGLKIEDTVQIQLATFREALASWQHWQGAVGGPVPENAG